MNTQTFDKGAFALHDLVRDPARDITMKLDQAGFVIDASPNANLLGIDPQSLLLMPHIADFASADYRSKVTRYFHGVVSGNIHAKSIEFPINFIDPPQTETDAEQEAQWYALDLRCNDGDGFCEQGAFGVLQSVQHKYTSPSKRAVGAISDPFTGLAERRCFVSTLIGHITMDEAASLVVFAIDGMRAIFMQYGQGTADEIRWGFARFLETMTERHHTLGQIDEERFGVIIPGMCPHEARQWANDALHIFAKLAMPANGRSPELCASAGVARAELSAEWTVRQAELGLVMARSGGGMQAAICQPHSSLSNGRLVERAMEAVVRKSVERVT